MSDPKEHVLRIEADPTAAMLSPPHTALIMIDMQRDFLEPGGFGESLGNDVSVLRKAILPCKEILVACRQAEMMVVHTREGHLPDLSDLPRCVSFSIYLSPEQLSMDVEHHPRTKLAFV